MKKVLILNLKRLGDVYTTAHLVNSIHRNHPGCEVSLLTYEESRQAAKNIKGINQIYSINRKEIISVKANRIFKDCLALEKLVFEMSSLKAVEWDSIINYSNDSVSAFLCSYLSVKPSGSKIGISFNPDRTVRTFSDWDIVLNDVLTDSALSPVHFTDVLHKMCNQKLVCEGEKIKLNPRHNESAYRNIQQLRKHLGGDEAINVIALQISSSSESKSPLLQTYIDLIKILTRTSHFVPMLVIAPSEDDRQRAKEINAVFDNKLVVAEADLSALASVLTNVDYLVTPDTVTKHIADLCDTACLEISLGEAPFFKQGTRNLRSLILTVNLETRLFTNELPNLENSTAHKDQRDMLCAKDIFQCIMLHFSAKPSTLNLSPGLSLYSPFEDSLGINYKVIAGEKSVQINSQRNIARYFLLKLFDLPSDEALIHLISKDIHDSGTQEIDNQKEGLGNITRDLLATLRGLIQYQENANKGIVFVQCLEKLLTDISGNTLGSVITRIFRGRAESINLNSKDSNIKAMEALLYEMKSDIQLALKILKEIEFQISDLKKANLISRFEDRDNKPNGITFI